MPEDLKIKVTGDTADFEARIKAIEEKLKSVDPAADQVGKSLEDMGEKGKAGAEKAESAFSKLGGAVESFVGNLGAMAAEKALSLLSDGIGLIKRGFEETIRAGVEFDQAMQDSKGGIAAVTMAALDFKDASGKILEGQDAVNASFRLATEIQEKLVEAAKKTPATYTDLVAAFQNGFLPAMQAGVEDTDRFIKILVDASNAAGVLGVQSQGLSQEITALFRGEAGPDNKLVNALKVTKEEMENVVKSGGSMADFLDKKLKPFADAAAVSAGNFSVVISGMKDTFAQTAGELAKPIFMELIKGAGEAEKYLAGLKGELKTTGEALGELTAQLIPVAKGIADATVASVQLGANITSNLIDQVNTLRQGFKAVGDAVGEYGDKLVKLSEMSDAALQKIGLKTKDAGDAAEKAKEKQAELAVTVGSVGEAALRATPLIGAFLADVLKLGLAKPPEQGFYDDFAASLSKMTGKTVDAATAERLLKVEMKDRKAIVDEAKASGEDLGKVIDRHTKALYDAKPAVDADTKATKDQTDAKADLATTTETTTEASQGFSDAVKKLAKEEADAAKASSNHAAEMEKAKAAADRAARGFIGASESAVQLSNAEVSSIETMATAGTSTAELSAFILDLALQYGTTTENIVAAIAALRLFREESGKGRKPDEPAKPVGPTGDTQFPENMEEATSGNIKSLDELSAAHNRNMKAANDAANAEANFSEQLQKAGVLIVSYSETLRGLHGQIVELNEEQNKLVDGLARVAGQYSLTDVESRRLLTTMEKKLELLGQENDWFTNQARIKAVEEYTNGLQDLIDAWSMARVDMPSSAIAIADLNTQMAEAVRIADQLRKSFGG